MANSPRPPTRTASSSWPAWIPTAPPRISTAPIPTGSRATPPASPIARRQVRHLRQQPLLRRVPSRRPARNHRALAIPKASPTTAGAAWAATASATARTARANSATQPASRSRSTKDWNDPTYRQWIDWNYARRLEIWDLNNRVTQAAGGPDCLWIGMNSGSVSGQSSSLPRLQGDLPNAPKSCCSITSRATMPPASSRTATPANSSTALLGWDKLAPEAWRCTAAAPARFVPAGEQAARRSAHVDDRRNRRRHSAVVAHVGAYHEDRRMYHTAEPVFRWHKEHEQYLVNRQPGGRVGIVWSQRNTDFFGRDEAADSGRSPYRGMHPGADQRAHSLHAGERRSHGARSRMNSECSVLPNVGALSDSQCAAMREFVEEGGGRWRPAPPVCMRHGASPGQDFALAELFGAHAPSPDFGRRTAPTVRRAFVR